MKADFYQSLVCLAITLDKLGRHDEAEAILPKLAQSGGDVYAYQFAQIYAQWGIRAGRWIGLTRRCAFAIRA